jgi:acetylserotonin N-methyltransferase
MPDAAPLAREVVATTDVVERIEIVSGDFFVDELPEGDLFALGRILHDWTEAKVLTLLERIFHRLPRDGALLIAEKLISADRSGPRWAHMQNLGMLLYTEGKERSLSEYKDLLERVGFGSVRGATTPSPLDAVLAVKP